jgi:hypothetical protein
MRIRGKEHEQRSKDDNIVGSEEVLISDFQWEQ